ncbi:hypothetical protein GCM10027053_15360 [Intrasporangium mesophilum]
MVAVHQLDALGRDVGAHGGSGRSHLERSASIVGRDADLAGLAEVVERPGVRWITVTGRSGIGKSSLLRALVERLQAHRLPERRRTTTGGASARVLWVDAHGLRPDERVIDRLRTRVAGHVVVVDDVDRFAGHGAELHELLTDIPDTTVVASALGPVGLAQELTYRLTGLDVGDPARPSRDTPALALFIDRALRVDPTFSAEDVDLHDVSAIVTHLHGVPLDIEIAAANVRLLGTRGLVRELTKPGLEHARITLRAGSNGLDRGQALGSAIRLSYARLSSGARRMLRSLSVFAAPFTLDQARAMNPTGDDGELVDALTELVDAWLVEPAGPQGSRAAAARDSAGLDARWELAPLTKELALRLAEEAGESNGLRDRHAEFHAALARQWACAVDDAREHDGMPQLIRALPELCGAVDWWSARGAPDRALRLCADLAPAALRVGRQGAMTRSLRDLLANPLTAQADPLTRGDALVWLAQAAIESTAAVDAMPGVIAHWREGLELIRSTGNPLALLRALGIGVHALPLTHDVDMTLGLLAEGRALAESLVHPAWTARFELWAGMLAHQSRDVTTAWELGVSALARSRRAGDVHCQVACGLLLIPLAEGMPAVAGGIPSAAELLEMSLSLDDASFASIAMAFLAENAIDDRDPITASRWISLRLNEITEASTWTAGGFSLMLMARVHLMLGELEQAARLHGAVLPLLPTLIAACPPIYADRYLSDISRLREELEPERFERLTHEGSLQPWADALATTAMAAAQIADHHADHTFGAPPVERRSRGAQALSAREEQVLQQIVDGLTNREIAQRLGVTAKTVMHHSVAIYRKLGVRGRAEAVAWAVRHAG